MRPGGKAAKSRQLSPSAAEEQVCAWTSSTDRFPSPLGADPSVVLREYLSAARTASPKTLAANAVILIDPQHRLGEIAWLTVSSA